MYGRMMSEVKRCLFQVSCSFHFPSSDLLQILRDLVDWRVLVLEDLRRNVCWRQCVLLL